MDRRRWQEGYDLAFRTVKSSLALVIATFIVAQVVAWGAKGAHASIAAENSDDEIIYLDTSGVIRVVDITQTDGDPNVEWFSPSGNWTNFALGDVNADGDMEIVAVGADGLSGKLAIFDPVVLGADLDTSKVIEGIPWDTLYETTLSGIPRLVASGEFDTTVPGDEIIYNHVLPEPDRIDDDWLRFVVLSSEGSKPDGRAWQAMVTHDTGNDWTWISTGNIDGTGIDEVALVDKDRGNLSIYRVSKEDGLVRFFRNVDVNKEWRNVEIGQFINDTPEEVVAVREADFPLATTLALRYAGSDNFADPDAFAAHNNPSPRFVFLADIGGNGDKEMVILRKVRPEVGSFPRMFIYDYAGGNADNISLRESALDTDNGYLTGVGGDVDGDGRDEIILLRDNFIKIFTEPESSTSSEEIPVTANTTLIGAGNLDANGLGGIARFGVVPSSITDNLNVDDTSSQHSLLLSDIATGAEVPFSWRLEKNSAWASISAESSRTPATFSVVFDTAGLLPGEYSDRLVVETNDERVKNQPYLVDLSLTVKSGIASDPASLSYVYAPCEGELPRTTELSISGTSGLTVTTGLQPARPWIEVLPLSGTVPMLVNVTVDPTKHTSNFESTELVLTAQLPNESTGVERVPVNLVCATNQLHLPAISR